MLKSLADNRNPASYASRLRARRFELLRSLLQQVDGPLRILDVGGTQQFWDAADLPDDRVINVTLLNRTEAPVSSPRYVSVAGDARKLDFDDASFDVVFSNSVIEHVGTFDQQQQMASEVCRVGRRHFVQTPNRWFPIEPHFLVPLFQFFPVWLRVWLLQHRKLGWVEQARDRATAKQRVTSIRLLGRKEFKALFPGSAIFDERALGLTKSFIAHGGWPDLVSSPERT